MRDIGAQALPTRDPGTAAMLSVIPGLGQLYNGDSRKGILFLDVAAINAGLLGVMLFAHSIVDLLTSLGTDHHMKINSGVITSLKHFSLGHPASLVVLGLVITFGAYAVRDAYDQARIRKRRAIYADSILDMPEAASGSYIAHASIILALGILTLFFFIPKPPVKQMVEIQLISQQKTVPPVKAVRSTVKANNASEAHGRNNPQEEINHQPPKTSNSSKAQAKPVTEQSKPAPPQPVLRPVQQNQQMPPASQVAPPMPTIKPLLAMAPQPSSLPQPKMPQMQPALNKSAVPAPTSINRSATAPALPSAATAATVQAPLLPNQISAPLLGRGSNNIPSPVAAPLSPGGTLAAGGLPINKSIGGLTSGNSSSFPRIAPGGGAQSGPAANGIMGGPAPFQNAKSGTPGSGTSTGPAPIFGTPRSNNNENGTGPGGAGNGPKPTRAGNTPGTGPADGIVPSIGPGIGNKPLNNSKSYDDKPASPPAEAINVDFTKYMENLQRKIKRSWFPPKDSLSKTVRVRFKIHTNGEMSNLHIVLSSKSDTADNAALNAVQNAAPFEHLPKGSPEAVDIEFTFDYNVFSGRRF